MTDNNKLLLVDDEKDIVTILKAGLEQHGFKVDDYTNPKEALDNFKPVYYERIITDIRMPGISGFELARQIYAKDPKAQICFLTSFEILEDEARKVFSTLPSYCFIKKPITPTMLVQHLHNHIAAR